MDCVQEPAATSPDEDAATETRPTSGNVMGRGTRTVLESLRRESQRHERLKHVLAGQVSVAAFGSSI